MCSPHRGRCRSQERPARWTDTNAEDNSPGRQPSLPRDRTGDSGQAGSLVADRMACRRLSGTGANHGAPAMRSAMPQILLSRYATRWSPRPCGRLPAPAESSTRLLDDRIPRRDRRRLAVSLGLKPSGFTYACTPADTSISSGRTGSGEYRQTGCSGATTTARLIEQADALPAVVTGLCKRSALVAGCAT